MAPLRRALLAVDGAAPADIRLEVVDDRCTAAGRRRWRRRYGTDLQVLGDAVPRRWPRTTLAGLLLGAADAVDVRVSVVDVTLDDPRR